MSDVISVVAAGVAVLAFLVSVGFAVATLRLTRRGRHR
jgi:hypothetical protein